MDEISKIHVGLDVHKDSISVGVAEPGRSGGRLVAKTAHDVGKLIKLLIRIGPAEQLHLVYEAGPTGFGLQRALTAAGYACEVIAPSQMPRRAGDRVKTDGRDCIQLAECSRAGQLRAVWIPEPADEAIRDLSRAREDAVNSRTQARHQLKGLCQTAADRGGLALPLQGSDRHACASPSAGAVAAGTRHRLDGATAPEQALHGLASARPAGEQGLRSGGQGAHRLRVGAWQASHDRRRKLAGLRGLLWPSGSMW